MTKPHAVSFGVGATSNIRPFNLATMLVQCGRFPTHIFPVFRMSDYTRVYFEAMFNEGFCGPYPLAKAELWARRRFWRSYKVRWLVCSEDAVRIKYEHALRLVQAQTPYAKAQLFAKLASKIKGWPMDHDPSLVDCGESTTIIARPDFEFTDSRNPIPDSVTPVSVWRRVLYYASLGTTAAGSQRTGA